MKADQYIQRSNERKLIKWITTERVFELFIYRVDHVDVSGKGVCVENRVLMSTSKNVWRAERVSCKVRAEMIRVCRSCLRALSGVINLVGRL